MKRRRRISRRNVSRRPLPLCRLRLPLWYSSSIGKDWDGDKSTRSILEEIIDKVLEILRRFASRCLSWPLPWRWVLRLLLRLRLLLLWLRLPSRLLPLCLRLLLRHIRRSRIIKEQIKTNRQKVASLRPPKRTVICNIRKGLCTCARHRRRRHRSCTSTSTSTTRSSTWSCSSSCPTTE